MQMYRCSASMATRELLSDWCLSFQRTYWSLISSTECLRRCLLCHVYISHNVKRRQPSSQSSSSSSSFSCWCYLYTLHVLTRSRLVEKAWADLNTGSCIMSGRKVALFWTWTGTVCLSRGPATAPLLPLKGRHTHSLCNVVSLYGLGSLLLWRKAWGNLRFWFHEEQENLEKMKQTDRLSLSTRDGRVVDLLH